MIATKGPRVLTRGGSSRKGQNDAGSRAPTTSYWENLVLVHVVDLFLESKGLYQGCALAEPGGPWRLTFALGRLENHRFFIQIICWAP